MVLAHAFGQRYELPIPLLIFVLGRGAVVLVSFMLIATRTVSSAPAHSPVDVATLGPLRVVPAARPVSTYL